MKVITLRKLLMSVLLVAIMSGCAYSPYSVQVINSKPDTKMDIKVKVPFKTQHFTNVLYGNICEVFIYSIYNSRGGTYGSVVATIYDMQDNVIGTYADTFYIYRDEDVIISIDRTRR